MLKRFTPHLLLLLSGASLTLAFAPFNMWLLTIPALALAIRQVIKLKHRPFLAGWLFGAGWFGAGISWVHVSIADFGGLPIGQFKLRICLNHHSGGQRQHTV